MAIYKRHNKWGISYRDPDGKWVRKLLDGATKKEAEAKVGAIKKSILLGTYWDEQRKVEDPPFDVFALEFTRWFRQRTKSIDAYDFQVRSLIRYFKTKKLSQITPKMVEGFQEVRLGAPSRMNGRKIGPATVNREVALLRRIYNHAMKHGAAKTNPAVSFKRLPEPPIREKFLEDDKAISGLIEAASSSRLEHLRPLIIAALQTGCRKGELLGLRWEDVSTRSDPPRITIKSPKNSLVHHITLDSVMVNLLKGLRVRQMRLGIRSEWVFCKRDGSRLHSVNNSWARACLKAGLVDQTGKPNLHFHDLRHTFASRHVMAGTPLYVVSQLLNHKDPTVVKRYAHLSPEYQKEVAERNASLASGWMSRLKPESR